MTVPLPTMTRRRERTFAFRRGGEGARCGQVGTPLGRRRGAYAGMVATHPAIAQARDIQSPVR